MRIKTLLVAFTFASATVTAQTLPNPTFESWTGQVPDGWNTNGVPVTKATAAGEYHGGAAAVKITSTNQTAGALSTARVNAAGFVLGGGAVINAKPTNFGGWYKYTGSDLDSGFVKVDLYNGTTKVSTGQMRLAPSATWKQFNLTLTPLTSGVPDTARISFLSSDDLPVNNSTLWVDDVSFSGSVGIDEPTVKTLGIYPNPATGNKTVNIKFTDAGYNGKDVVLKVYDITGKEVYSKMELLNTNGTIQFTPDASLPAGAYFCTLLSDDKTIAGGKLAIE